MTETGRIVISQHVFVQPFGATLCHAVAELHGLRPQPLHVVRCVCGVVVTVESVHERAIERNVCARCLATLGFV